MCFRGFNTSTLWIGLTALSIYFSACCVPRRADILCLYGWILVARAASVRSCWELPACPAEPIPGGSQRDVPPAKAGPIRDHGNASVITFKKKKLQHRSNYSQRREAHHNDFAC